MEQAIAPVIKMAQAAYRRSQVATADASLEVRKPAASSNAARCMADTSPDTRVATIRPKTLADLKVTRFSNRERLWTVEELLFELERVATRKEKLMLKGLLRRLAPDAKHGRIESPSARHGDGRVQSHGNGLLKQA
jgi:hypothetical protein